MNALKKTGRWGWGLLWLNAAVHAQTPMPVGEMTIAAPALPFRQYDKVEITGSAILAKEAREALPIQVLTQRDIAQSGAPDLASFLQHLPVMHNFTDAGMATGTVMGGPETAAIHGNQSGTLVLLNGRRLPYYGSQTIVGERAVVDLNFLPLSAVERIEILTDGASSRYGSDAVAGVVNVITRSRTQGLTLATESILPSMQGGAGRSAHLSWGTGVAEREGYSLRAYLSLSHQDAVLAGWRQPSSEGAVPLDIGGHRYWFPGSNLSDYSAPGQTYYSDHRGNTYFDAHGQCAPGWYLFATDGLCSRNTQQAMTLYPATQKSILFMQGERVLSNNWLLSADVLGGMQTQDMVQTGHAMALASQYDDAGREILTEGTLWGLPQQRYTNRLQHFSLGLKGQVDEWNVSIHAAHGAHHVERNDTGGQVYYGSQDIQLPTTELFLDPSAYSERTKALFEKYRVKTDLLIDKGQSVLNGFNALISRTVMDLDNGPVEIGLGVDAREEKTNFEPDSAFSAMRPAWDGSRKVWAGYGELRGPWNEHLETTIALRHDRYSDFGNVTTGKLGGKLRLNEQAWLRGSMGTGFRAPTLGQLVPLQTQFISNGHDHLVVAGNSDLKPERSKQWTLGGQWEPNRQWSLGADLWNLAIRDTFGFIALQEILESATLRAKYQDPNDPTRFIVPNMNLGGTLSRGIDYFVRWRQPMDYGRWQLAVRGTTMLKAQQDTGSGMVSNLGTLTTQSNSFTPRHKFSVIPSLERDGWLYSAALHYRSGHTDTIEVYPVENLPALAYRHEVGSWVTLDLAVQANWVQRWSFNAALINATNRLPPLELNLFSLYAGADTRAGDYYGRRLQLKLQYRF